MSRADLARAVGKTPQEISRALNGRKDGGSIPSLWQSILDALDLELTAQPKPGEKEATPPPAPTLSPDVLTAAAGAPIPLNLSSTARRVLDTVATGGKLARVGEGWQLETGGQVQSVDPRTVARLVSEGLLVSEE